MTANRSKIRYGSQSYLLLCYGKMLKKPINSRDARECLSGVFRRPADVRSALGVMCRSGFFKKVGDDLYQITPNGIDEIFHSVSRFRLHRENVLGKKYMASVQQRLRAASPPLFTGDIESRSSEDKILDEMYSKFVQEMDRERELREKREIRRKSRAKD